MQDGFAREIAERYIGEHHFSRNMRKYFGTGPVCLFGRLVDDPENPLCRGESGLKLADDVGKLVDGAGKFSRIHHELGHAAQAQKPYGAGGDLSGFGKKIEDSAENHDEGEGQVIDEIDGGADDRPVIFGFIIGVYGLFVLLVEFFRDRFRAVIRPDRLGARKHFFGKTVQLAQFFRPLAEQRPDFFRFHPGERDRDRHGNGKYEQQGPGDAEHIIEGTADGVNAGEHLDEIGGQGSVHRVDVVGNAADGVPRRMRVEIGDGQSGEAFKKLFPHPIGNPLAEIDHGDGHQIGQNGGQEVADKHFTEVVPDNVHQHSAF